MNIPPASIIKHPNTSLIGKSILFYPSIPSTMDIARKMVNEGTKEGTVIVAGEQTSGRGRLERRWLSPPGTSLSLSIILRPALKILPQLNMAATLAVVQSVERITSLKPVIKWPNDVLIDGKKLSGILIDSIFQGNELKAAIIGIGINVKLNPSAFPDISNIATSLSVEMNREVSRRDVLYSLVEELDNIYQGLALGEPIYEKWLKKLETLGKMVKVKWRDTIEEGYVESVNADGSLVLKRHDGSLITMVAGEVTLHI